MEQVKKAAELFENNHNCCQAVIGALHYELNIDFDTAINLGAAFGGGVGRQGLTCGAVSAGYMALGLHIGKNRKNVGETKAETLTQTKEFNKTFIEKHNSLLCNELLGDDISSEEGYNNLLECGKFKSHCPHFVESATEITLKLIKDIK